MGMNQSQEDSNSDHISNNTLDDKDKIDFIEILKLISNFSKGSKLSIPFDIILEIFDWVDYWPSTIARNSIRNFGCDNQSEVYLSLDILPILRVEVNKSILLPFVPYKVHVSLSSKDQGWSSYPREYGKRSSHTWGDLTFNEKGSGQILNGKKYFVYRNIHAGRNWENFHIVFDEKSQLVKDLNSIYIEKYSDKDLYSFTLMIQLWIYSLYPQWRNMVDWATIQIFWKVNNDLISSNFAFDNLIRKIDGDFQDTLSQITELKEEL